MQGWSALRKTVVIVAVVFFGLAGIGSLSNQNQNKNNQTQTPAQARTVQTQQQPTQSVVQGANTESQDKADTSNQAVGQTAPETSDKSSSEASSLKPNCDPNYTGACVPNVYPSDVDCAGGSGNGPYYVSGPVHVIGVDHYGLDGDGDGLACE